MRLIEVRVWPNNTSKCLIWLVINKEKGECETMDFSEKAIVQGSSNELLIFSRLKNKLNNRPKDKTILYKVFMDIKEKSL